MNYPHHMGKETALKNVHVQKRLVLDPMRYLFNISLCNHMRNLRFVYVYLSLLKYKIFAHLAKHYSKQRKKVMTTWGSIAHVNISHF